MALDCIFCQIVREIAPADLVYKNDSLVVFKDIHPHAPVHLLIVPRRHIRSVNNLDLNDGDIVSEMILTGQKMAKQTGIAESGYKLLFNVERGGGQVVFHLHLHLLGGWK
ncbi:MAG: histidine triad nucleotide-binding protein [Thermodesulfobacteriota bacterium]